MKRQIIKIDESKCNGCGECIPGCHEGALQIIDGKVRLISDLFCDGLGACLGTCPVGAITLEEREAKPYDEKLVMSHLVEKGENTIKAHLKHLKDHNETKFLGEGIEYLKENNIPVPNLMDEPKSPCGGGCPGAAFKKIVVKKSQSEDDSNAGTVKSELTQWPIQLQLVNPQAPFFNDADLLVAADCVPFAYGNFHRDFLKDKPVIMFCPKLDQVIDHYIEKLVEIFKHNDIRSITILRMEVPCCGGTESIVMAALERSGVNIEVNTKIITIDGQVR